MSRLKRLTVEAHRAFHGVRGSAACTLLALLIVGCGGSTGPQTGSIRVGLSMTGAQPDADGCVVAVDGGPGQVMRAEESFTFDGLSQGTHDVTISDVAHNCLLQGEASREVAVSANEVTPVDFSIDCPAPGSIEVTTRTTGSAIDPDGYTVTVDLANDWPLGVDDWLTVADLAVGQYDVALTGLADNCGVIGENPISVTVLEGELSQIAFNVACPPFHDHIAFIDPELGHIFVVESDGSNPVNVTEHLGPEFRTDPDWSPDGTRLLFRALGGVGTQLWIMRVGGSMPVLILEMYCIHDPKWSPDGTRIAFTGTGENYHDIYVVDADGSNLVNLTNSPTYGEYGNTWSPDGTRVAFTAYREEQNGLYVMDADGSNPTLLRAMTGGAMDLAWSPDGSRIAYAGDCETSANNQEICVVGADGSNPVNLTNHSANDWDPDWSPDGSRLAFLSRRGNGYDIYVMQSDGSGVVHLVWGGEPTWSPGQ